AVTVLSSDDPVRVHQRFATLDGITSGRAEVSLGAVVLLNHSRCLVTTSKTTKSSSTRNWNSLTICAAKSPLAGPVQPGRRSKISRFSQRQRTITAYPPGLRSVAPQNP